MRENRPSGSEGGVAFGPSLPLSILPSPGSGKIADAHKQKRPGELSSHPHREWILFTAWIEFPLFDPEFELGDWPVEAGDWQTWLFRGGFPSALSAPSEGARKLWFAGYVQTYLEQSLFQSLQSWRSLDPCSHKLYFWCDQAGREVDFVLEKDGVLVALEIKTSRQVVPSDTDGIAAFRQSLVQKRRFRCGAVLHAGSARSLGQDLWALPWCWLLPETSE